jgi:SAM-dependent methyltransferase
MTMTRRDSTFDMIYRNRLWGSGSGPGSQPETTQRYRRVLERLLTSHDIGSVLDVGCGDWAFSRLIDWGSACYRGIDIVPDLIAENDRRFAMPGIAFECADVLTDFSWPAADLLLCKDVLQHWPNSRVVDFCATVLPRYPFAMLTSDVASPTVTVEDLNADIPMGGWRTLDLEAAPFHLGPEWRLDYAIPSQETKRIYFFRH